MQCVRECRPLPGLQVQAVGTGERQHSPCAGSGIVQRNPVQLLREVEDRVEADAGGRHATGASPQPTGRHGLRHRHSSQLVRQILQQNCHLQLQQLLTCPKHLVDDTYSLLLQYLLDTNVIPARYPFTRVDECTPQPVVNLKTLMSKTCVHLAVSDLDSVKNSGSLNIVLVLSVMICCEGVATCQVGILTEDWVW